MFIYLIYVGRVLPVHNQLSDGYTRPHWHSTRPKDGWTGPWMRQWTVVYHRLLSFAPKRTSAGDTDVFTQSTVNDDVKSRVTLGDNEGGV